MATRHEKGELYVDTNDAIAALKMSRQYFYTNVRDKLQPHHFDGRTKPWYKDRDVRDLRDGKTVRKADVVIEGILKNWVASVREQGHTAEVFDRVSPRIVTIPEDVAGVFAEYSDREVVLRSRGGSIDGHPCCMWTTYYPIALVRGATLESMLRDSQTDTMALIQGQHGLAIHHAKDQVTSRLPTPNEQVTLEIVPDDPVLVLRRTSYSEDGKVMLFQEQVLVSAYFLMTYTYETEK